MAVDESVLTALVDTEAERAPRLGARVLTFAREKPLGAAGAAIVVLMISAAILAPFTTRLGVRFLW